MTLVAKSKTTITGPSTSTPYLSKWDKAGFGIFLEEPNLTKPYQAKVKALRMWKKAAKGSPSPSKRKKISKFENFMFGLVLAFKPVLFPPLESQTAAEKHKAWLESREQAREEMNAAWNNFHGQKPDRGHCEFQRKEAASSENTL